MANNDPFAAFRFKIEIDGLIKDAGFSECSGLSAETEVEDVREGGLNEYLHRLPKGSKYGNLTLKHGLTTSESLWNWHSDVVRGKIQRRRITVMLMDREGAEERRWCVEQAYPVKWMGPDLKADGSAVAIESLEFAHYGFLTFG
jgi:phage tail-like protein